MKKNLLFTMFILLSVVLFGQKLPFQGKLIETDIPIDGTRTLVFSIASQGWSETHTDVPITEGLYFVVLGSINPLPDSLFYGVDERSLDISVDGTALSPVILFKPLATPFEGGELNVKNDEGTIVGVMKAANYPFGKNGEIIVNGTNGLENVAVAGFSHWQTPGNNYGAIRVSNDEGHLRASLLISPYRGLHGSGELILMGDSTSSLTSGFNAFDEKFDYPYFSLRTVDGLRANIDVVKSDSIERGRLYVSSNINESISIQPHGWFAYKDGIHTGQFQSQNWGGLGASGYLSINGTNTKNVDISSRHWENPNLPWMKLIGSENQDVIQLSAETDSLESGSINILSKNGNATYLSANNISSGNSSTQFYELTSQDWGGHGPTGLIRLQGTSTQNFELTSQSWINPNFPWFKLSGENLGDAVQMFLDNDGTEAANINLFSLGRGSSSFTTDSWNMNGPNSTNIHIGSRSWEGTPDLPFVNFFGENDFHGIELSITRDEESNQFGWINLMSENGKSLHLSPEGVGVDKISLNTVNQNGGSSGEMFIQGNTTPNIQMGGQPWDNHDLGFLQVFTDKPDGNGWYYGAAVINANTDGTDSWGSMSLNNNGEQTIGLDGLNGTINLRSLDGKSLHLSPEGVGFEKVNINANEDGNGNKSGEIGIQGGNTLNIAMGGKHWEDNTDLPFLHMFGTNDGVNDFHAIDMSVDGSNEEVAYLDLRAKNGMHNWLSATEVVLHGTNGNQTFSANTQNDGNGDYGLIHLYSDYQKSIRMEPTSIGLRDDANGYHHLVDISTNNNEGNGWHGTINLNGSNTNNIQLGSKDWENTELPWLSLNGARTNLMHLTGIGGVNEFGYIHLMSEDGSTSNVSAYRIENDNGAGMTGYFGPDRATFNDNGQEMTYNAWGISGSGTLSISNGVNITGDVVVNGVTEHSSDRRFKKDIKSLAPNTLEKIQLIEGVSYDWRQNEFPNKNFSSDKQIGVIAQELEAQFPELVKTNMDGYKSVNYNGFTAVLLEAVKELNAKVEKLEAENMQLKVELSSTQTNTFEIAQLKDQMEALIKMVQTRETENNYINEPVSTPGLK